MCRASRYFCLEVHTLCLQIFTAVINSNFDAHSILQEARNVCIARSLDT